MKSTISVAQAKRTDQRQTQSLFRRYAADATNEQYYKAVAMILREMLSEKNSQFPPVRLRVKTLSRSIICVWSF